MTRVRSGRRIYTVVDVVKGVAADALSFRHLKDAHLCAERLRRDRNLDEDDVQIFESAMDCCERAK